jgi:uncharacterized protein DUF4350
MMAGRGDPSRVGDRRGRPGVILLMMVGVAVAGLLLTGPPASGPPSLASGGPGGTLALKRLLSGMGLSVRVAPSPPEPPATFVVLGDLRDRPEARRLLDWVEGGGRLVVADPGPGLIDLANLEAGPAISALSDEATLHPACAAPEASGVATIVAAGSDLSLSSHLARSYGCFPARTGAFEVSLFRGRGTAVLLGGASPFTNRFLPRADDAAFAVRLLDAGGPVVFGPPLPPEAAGGPSKSLWALLPAGARAAVIGLMIAAVAFALVRGRRMGRPVVERPLSPIAGTELVRASANLYRLARSVPFAGGLLREAADQRLRRRLGLPQAASPEQVAAVLSRAAAVSGDRAQAALGGADPVTDDELIALGRELDALRNEVEGASR